MPLYDYECPECLKIFEIEHTMTDEFKYRCPTCNKEMEKLIRPPAIKFKGSGFHVNDYPKSK